VNICFKGFTTIAQLLIENGCDIEITNNHGVIYFFKEIKFTSKL